MGGGGAGGGTGNGGSKAMKEGRNEAEEELRKERSTFLRPSVHPAPLLLMLRIGFYTISKLTFIIQY